MAVSLIKIVVVGHVDHGKSTLIGRLLHDSGALAEGRIEQLRAAAHGSQLEWAYVMDHIQEEREQERTIDSAQAFFATANRVCRIIDAPGHREFLKNMVTGAAQADAAVLVIDAETGIEEQTRRHAALLAMLGLKRPIVAINKMDIVGGRRERFDAVWRETSAFFDELGLSADHVIPISALKGWNLAERADALAWYGGPTLLEAIDSIAPARPLGEEPMRFPVQDVYTVEGRKVVVGRVESGRLVERQSVVSLPSGAKARIGSIEKFGAARRSAEAGESIGLTLEGLDRIGRGDVLCDSAKPAAVVTSFEANILWLGKEPWRHGEALVLESTTQVATCRIERVHRRIDSSTLETIEQDASHLEPAEIGRVVMVADRPLVLERFGGRNALGRFVLARDGTLSGGGTVARLLASSSEAAAGDA